ncbi:NACHT domain-containing protein [Nocardia lasii]|uniref:NACHT domain-containing protein n=1 Tax=Nocardia lasii TaxID=1616107 RepID=A0ABW1JXT4_9NOCA
MTKYELGRLGAQEFENLIQALVKEILGNGTITFGVGPDGGREAEYTGDAPYPSATNRWAGTWVIQAKFHDTELLTVKKSRQTLIGELPKELNKFIERDITNYILATNVPLSPNEGTGTIDTLHAIATSHKSAVANFHAWGAEEISRFLDKYQNIRSTYAHFLTPGDLIAKLINRYSVESDFDSTTIRAYLYTTLRREQDAQLDQAGDATDNHLQLEKVFIELHGSIQKHRTHQHLGNQNLPEIEKYHRSVRRISIDAADKSQIPIVHLLLHTEAPRVVLIGGPGEGKSTAGQYLAQLHRARIVGNVKNIAISAEYIPQTPRLPFRIILREFAQWIAETKTRGTNDSNGSLDDYICHQIQRTTCRKMTPAGLHKLFNENPILLILDGLDEVTDPSLKRTVTDTTEEFVARMSDIFMCNMQVLATTRPTGYNDQYNPETYVHLVLENLQPNQVRTYVDKWAKARNLDIDKSDKLKRGIEECLNDRHVKLLMNTPLQVTILILIITSGGRPPNQREALFNEYLDVIYRREQGKGSNIISTDKELLVGLHKFVGYTLQERASFVSATDSTLSAESYIDVVSRFLLSNDPYSDKQKMKQTLDAITIDAGERLVLLVEPTASRFGFELRSLQEFFAACHLSDTSNGTQERYYRFEAIARKYHWRNVALFFAGRVGRTLPGEASNIVAVCKAIDQEGIDHRLKRGAELALLIASDRALNPNRRLQRSLLEIGLKPISGKLTPGQYAAIEEVTLRLPAEDLIDHVKPILNEQITTLADALIEHSTDLLLKIDRHHPSLIQAISRMSSVESLGTSALSLALRLPITNSSIALVGELVNHLPSQVRKNAYVHAGRAVEPRVVFDALANIDNFEPIALEFLQTYATSFHIDTTDSDLDKFDPSPGLHWILHAILTLDVVLSGSRRMRARNQAPCIFDSHLREKLDEIYLDGDGEKFARLSTISSSDPLMAPFWAVHLWIGDVTTETAQCVIDFLIGNRVDGASISSTRGQRPAFECLWNIAKKGSSEISRLDLLPWLGNAGWSKWTELSRAIADFNRSVHLQLEKSADYSEEDVDLLLRSPEYCAKRADILDELPAIEWALYVMLEPGFGPTSPSYIIGNTEAQLDVILAEAPLTSFRRRALKTLLMFIGRTDQFSSASRILSYLVANRSHSDGGLICDTISILFHHSLPPQSLVDTALCSIGNNPSAYWQSSILVQAPPNSLAKKLVNMLGRQSSPELKAGAATLLTAIARSVTYRGPSNAGLEQPRLARIHRDLCSSEVVSLRAAGISLFILRRDWVPEFSIILRSAFLHCNSEIELDILHQLMAFEIQQALHVDILTAVLTDLIDIELYPGLDHLVCDGMRSILQMGDQSIGEEERSLGLPMPVY